MKQKLFGVEKNYTVDERNLILSNSSTLEFEFPIKKIIYGTDQSYVLLHVPNKRIYNQNIFAINNNGTISWQIEQSTELDAIGDCPFIEFEIRDQMLISWSWCGFMFTIDIKSGKIIDYVFTK